MKKIVFAVLMLVASTAAFAQQADRDVLLTPDGTLYAIEAENAPTNSANEPDSRFLTLTIQQGDTTTRTKVPASVSNGINLRPSLAYDSDSKTMFVFWLHIPNNVLSSELYLASYQKGVWGRAIAIDSRPNEIHFRANLRVAVTKHVSQLQEDGTYADAPATLVHVAWWEDTGAREGARYALLSIDKGTIASVETHELSEFVQPAKPAEVGEDFNREILRHPAIIDSGASNSVDVVFGDTTSNTFHRVTLKPIADGRLHIPIGNRGNHPSIPAPNAFSASWSGHVGTISGRDGSLVFTNSTADAVTYVMYADGKWSSVKKLSTGEKLSADAAIALVAKMVNAE